MPNFIDNVVSFFSPQLGCEREAWRQELERLKNYDAAQGGRLNGGWIAVNEPAEYSDRNSRDLVRARARDLERNSDMMGGLVSAFKRNVIGSGYTLQASTGDDALDDQIEAEWKNWCKKQNCDFISQDIYRQRRDSVPAANDRSR